MYFITIMSLNVTLCASNIIYIYIFFFFVEIYKFKKKAHWLIDDENTLGRENLLNYFLGVVFGHAFGTKKKNRWHQAKSWKGKKKIRMGKMKIQSLDSIRGSFTVFLIQEEREREKKKSSLV